jgi:UDP-glucose-4-epimerase GalE
MNVLVTGGAGYIGSHTAKALARSGYQPIVLDNLSAGHRWAVQWGPLVEGELADEDLIRSVLRRYEIEAVMHFAASAYVGESMQTPARYYRNNVANTLTLLDAMLAEDVRRIIFSSSCATYGSPEMVPISEDTPQAPVNPYGETKLIVERMLGWYGRSYELRSVALRYFNAAGADTDLEIGEQHDPEPHLIPRVLQAASGTLPHVDIYGTDYSTPDGTAVRDYIHVTDLADGHVRALRYLIDGGATTALNLGTGSGYSVREIVSAVERTSKLPVPVREMPRRPGDPPILVANARRSMDLLGWRPQYSSIETIVDTAWRWHCRTADDTASVKYVTSI